MIDPTDTIGDDVRLYRGDCLAVMSSLPVASVDLFITSPPYNLGNTSGGGFIGAERIGNYSQSAGLAKRGGGGKWNGGALANGYGSHSDDMPHDEYVAWQKSCLREMWRLLTPTGAIFYNHKPRMFNGQVVTPFEYNPDLPVRQVVIWARAGGINFAPTHYVPTHEWIVIFAKPGFRLKSKGASGVGDVWRIPQEANPTHPAPFPLSLLSLPSRILETTQAESVMDPFMGSGTTVLAAMQAGVKGTGIELDPHHYATALRRLTRCPRPRRTAAPVPRPSRA